MTSTLTPASETRRTITGDQSTVETPRIRTVFRRLLFWLGALAVLAIIVFVIFAATAPSQSAGELAATNTKPAGARALLQVLRQDGVSVQAPTTLRSAVDDLNSNSNSNSNSSTLVLYDPNSILVPSQLDQFSGIVDHIVLIEPSFDALHELAPDLAQAGFVDSKATANCDLPVAKRAGAVSGLGKGYRITETSNAVGCFGTGGTYGLVNERNVDGTVTVIGSATMFTNGAITRSGNAALALGIFGQTAHTVWYLPSLSDYPTAVADGVIPSPPWVGMLVTLGALVALAAAFWRGRRLGPVVVERLPVIVRASETVEGRARLYQRSSARTHAIDNLRIGSLGRLAALCGLPKRATLDDVLGAVAAATGRPLAQLRALLVDSIPSSDADLIRASDDLRQLELETAERTRPA